MTDNNTICVNGLDNYISIALGNQEIRIRKSHAYYTNDYTQYFNYYFSAVQPTIIEGKQVVDYTVMKKHKVIGYDLHEIIFPTMPEPICSSLQYVDFAELTQDSVVLDLGAYSGLAAILFDQAIVAAGARSGGGGGRVISVEADIDNFAAAKLNFEEYKKNTGRKIELIHAAVWSDNNGVEFFMDSGMGSAVSCYSGEREKKAKIQSYTLSSLAELYNLEHVDFIKCDIEGAETVIFNDNIFFNKYSPRIIVEFHEFVKPHGAKNITVNTLTRQGYICTPVIQRGIESAGETLLECVTNKYLRETIKNFREMSEALSRFVGKRLQKINSGMIAGVYKIFEAVLRRIMGNDAATITFIKYTDLFDDVYYRHFTDSLSSNSESIQHYIRYGVHENKNPCAWFDGKIYLDCYIDVKESGMNPFYHYCRYGFPEGRKKGILFYQDSGQ